MTHGSRRSPAPVSTVSGTHRVPATCLGIFLLVWLALGMHPTSRADWLLENVPTLILVPLAVLTYRRFRFSNQAYVQATIFALLHSVGSHYTYSEVPLGNWLRDAFDLTRNHYDRVVHLLFGVLMLRPMRELALHNPHSIGWLATDYLSLAAVGFWSLAYEVVEWAVAAIADPAAGTAYLGTQGDVWDAQKDMALACVGAGLGLLLDRKTADSRQETRSNKSSTPQKTPKNRRG